MFPEIKYDFSICVLGTGMHIETDADINIIFTKYAKNPKIHIMVYEKVRTITSSETGGN